MINELELSIRRWNNKHMPALKKPCNKYTTISRQLQERVMIARRSLQKWKTKSSHTSRSSSARSSSTRSSSDNTECLSVIVQDLAKQQECIYNAITYLQYLDLYTKQITNNRWYYSRERKRILSDIHRILSPLMVFMLQHSDLSSSPLPPQQQLPPIAEWKLSPLKDWIQFVENFLFSIEEETDDY